MNTRPPHYPNFFICLRLPVVEPWVDYADADEKERESARGINFDQRVEMVGVRVEAKKISLIPLWEWTLD